MMDINKIIENRIRTRENNNRKTILENEIKRINNMNNEIVNECDHMIVLYYGEREIPKFECFSCGVKSSYYESCSDEKYIADLKSKGKIVWDISKYLSIVKKDVLFRMIEDELANMLSENKTDIDNMLVEFDKKIKTLNKQ